MSATPRKAHAAWLLLFACGDAKLGDLASTQPQAGSSAGVGGEGVNGGASGTSLQSGGTAQAQGGAGNESAGGGGGGSENGGAAGDTSGGSGGSSGAGAVCQPLATTASWEDTGIEAPPQSGLSPLFFSTSAGTLLLTRPLALWKLEGNQFTSLGGTPPSMNGSALSAAVVYEPSRDQLVLFGNKPLSGPLGDTWTMSLTDLTWKKRCEPCDVPPIHLGMAHDGARKVTVLVSRKNALTAQVSTAEWDGDAWTTVCGEGTDACPMGEINEASMAYDEARGVAVLLAFASPQGPQTWEYDAAQPVAQRWSQKIVPPEGLGGQLVYDPKRERVVLPVSTKDSLEWDGICWYYANDPDDTQKANLIGEGYDATQGLRLAIGYTSNTSYLTLKRP